MILSYFSNLRLLDKDNKVSLQDYKNASTKLAIRFQISIIGSEASGLCL